MAEKDNKNKKKFEEYNGDEKDKIQNHPYLTREEYEDEKALEKYSHTNNLHARFQDWDIDHMKKDLAEGRIPVTCRDLYYLHKRGLLKKLFDEVGYSTIKDLHDFTNHYQELWDSVDNDFVRQGGKHRYGSLRGTWAMEQEKLSETQLMVLNESQTALLQGENLARKVYVALRKLGMPPEFMCG
ncbi:hypothetical protein HY732_00180 [Candidatus Uhrbacteria bacterium]|nr:hypothetical protein [Candidatus Uhrbacteria bacterium]